MLSVPAQPRGSIAEPIPEIVFWVFGVIWIASPKVQVSHEAIEPVLLSFSLVTLSSAHPRADAPIALSELLKVDTFLEGHELTLGQSPADVLKF